MGGKSSKASEPKTAAQVHYVNNVATAGECVV